MRRDQQKMAGDARQRPVVAVAANGLTNRSHGQPQPRSRPECLAGRPPASTGRGAIRAPIDYTWALRKFRRNQIWPATPVDAQASAHLAVSVPVWRLGVEASR
jgi:hypothetical protein